MDASNEPVITREARDYASQHGKDYFIASAIISNSLAIRIIVNFFGRFYKDTVPFKMFPNEKEAIKWLEKFPKQLTVRDQDPLQTVL